MKCSDWLLDVHGLNAWQLELQLKHGVLFTSLPFPDSADEWLAKANSRGLPFPQGYTPTAPTPPSHGATPGGPGPSSGTNVNVGASTSRAPNADNSTKKRLDVNPSPAPPAKKAAASKKAAGKKKAAAAAVGGGGEQPVAIDLDSTDEDEPAPRPRPAATAPRAASKASVARLDEDVDETEEAELRRLENGRAAPKPMSDWARLGGNDSDDDDDDDDDGIVSTSFALPRGETGSSSQPIALDESKQQRARRAAHSMTTMAMEAAASITAMAAAALMMRWGWISKSRRTAKRPMRPPLPKARRTTCR